MSDVLSAINGVIWSDWLVYLCLATGVYFSVRSRFLQVRHVGGMIEQLVKGEKSASGVSSFQALAMPLSGRVGTGTSWASSSCRSPRSRPSRTTSAR
jgi:AGCS family alanine or glycine:cation symporter